jgi:4,5-DOPA dioxygenase extradiol
MNRKKFLKTIAFLPLANFAMNINYLSKISDSFTKSPKMPVLFLGHGNPMNAIRENEFVQGFRNIVTKIPKPNAILCVSAHWETKGTFVTAMEHPKTIHDFGGFPKELFEVQYPAPGSPDLAKQTQKLITTTNIELDDKWGLDHGAWSVIKHMYPNADIPVIQMSIDYSKPAQYHYELGKQLSALREKGVLIIGSGNIVHNLRMVDWQNMDKVGHAYDWAAEAKEKMNDFILESDHQSLINYQKNGKAFQLAIPTPEHYLPLIYALSLKDKKDNVSLFNDKAVGGSLSMTSVLIS